MAKGGRGKCLACASDKRQAIDAALMAGESFRTLKERYGISLAALHAHKREHVSPALAKIRQKRTEKTGLALLARFEAMAQTTAQILDLALASGNATAALAAIREQRGVLETIGRITGELKERPAVSVNLQTSPEWVAARTALMDVLRPHPDLTQQFTKKLKQLDLDG